MQCAVAPRAGAWIETLLFLQVCLLQLVAPRAGAWIETFLFLFMYTNIYMSRPARARGLKQKVRVIYCCQADVAPRAGAWIETLMPSRPIMRRKSRPARARGLKRYRPREHR